MERRRLVVDANILIRAVLGRGVKATFARHGEDVDFFAPEVAYAEAAAHLPAVMTKFDRAEEIGPALAYLDRLRATVVAVPEDAYLAITGVPTWTTDRIEIYLNPPTRGS